MMRPDNLRTQIFLDSGDVEDSKDVLHKIGFLDGQTTNPSLVSKNPEVKKCLNANKTCSRDDIYSYYKGIVQEVSSFMPGKSVSVEVYADDNTTSDEMVEEGKRLNEWVSTAHIKLPTTQEGLQAAHELTQAGLRVNMTLVFTQEQAAAVHAATKGAKKGDVFLSPFIGRLDDIGQYGLDLIFNCLKMYREQDSHVQVLAASIRSYDHLMHCMAMGCDIVTVPSKMLKLWGRKGMQLSGPYERPKTYLSGIAFEELDLSGPVESFNLKHEVDAWELTQTGIERFVKDWKSLIG